MKEPLLRTWAEVSLSQLRANYLAIQATVGAETRIAPVVKADAYGHGSIAVSRALESAGASWLAVSCVAEGITLREAGVVARVLVMGGVFAFEREVVYARALTPVVHSLEELRALDEAAHPLVVHLKIDTGMARLGVNASPAEVVSALRSLRHVHVEGLMSHFAAAEDFTSNQPAEQERCFLTYAEAAREAGVCPEILHFSSTNPVAYQRQSAWLSLVRPGLSLYGYVSPAKEGPSHALSVRPVLQWFARLVKIKEIAAGTPVGYMARFRAPNAMRIGTVAAGYADGIPHRLSMRGCLVSQGRPLPILGAVSMDLTTADLTLAPDLAEGDAVSVLGPDMDAQQIAELAGEIPYSVLCGIGNRVQRVYLP